MFSLSTIQNILNHVEGIFDCQFATLGCWMVKNDPLYLPLISINLNTNDFQYIYIELFLMKLLY